MWEGNEAWQMSREPVVTIGSVDGEEVINRLASSSVGRTASAAFLSEERIGIADGGDNEIRIYDRAGSRLSTLGGSGEGPGEFRRLGGIAAFAEGDSVVAWEAPEFRAGLRMVVFASGGEFVRESRLESTDHPVLVGVFEDGAVLTGQRPTLVSPGAVSERPPPGISRPPITYEIHSDAGLSGRTLGPVPGPETFTSANGARGYVFFARTTIVGVGASRVYVGDNEHFRIEVRDPREPGIAQIFSRPVESIPIRAAEIDSARESRRRIQARQADRSSSSRFFAPVDETPARQTRPAFTEIIEDHEGNVWVRHSRSPRDSVQTWSVFDTRARWLGEVDLPRSLSVIDIGDDEILGAELDSLGVSYVTVYRLLK